MRRAIEEGAEALRRGENPRLQGELATLYWGLYSGGDQFSIRTQMVDAVGESLCQTVEEGFVATVLVQPIPSLVEIADLSAENRHYGSWYALLAGMDLLWVKHPTLERLSDETLSSVLAISLVLPTYENKDGVSKEHTPAWRGHIVEERPDIARSAYTALLMACFRLPSEARSLVFNLSREPDSAWRIELVFKLLAECEPSSQNDLIALVLILPIDECRARLAPIATLKAEATATAKPEIRAFWLALEFVTGVPGSSKKLARGAPVQPDSIFVIRALTGTRVEHGVRTPSFDLSLQQMEEVLRAFGPVFPNTACPTAGWGDRSDHDAALYLVGLITTLSARPGADADLCLSRLRQEPALSSYHPWISSQLAIQREVSRQARYESPTWSATCAALRGGVPAKIEDLKALFLAHLASLAQDLRHSNLDQFRVFWNERSLELEEPRDEEYCRDRLLDYIRPHLQPIGLWAEPEGHMVADKRADIVIQAPNTLKLPVEVKRDSHRELWTAAENQLDRLYTRDPGAAGYGVYLVLYFGPERGGGIKPHPSGTPIADSPVELEKALNAAVPEPHRNRIMCVVVDVSPPESPVRKSGRKGGHRKRPAAPKP